MKLSITYFLCFSFAVFSYAQKAAYSVKAEQGDGIFSILRKQGLDPVKYYAKFVSLNQDNLKNGSQLYLGKAYLIPEAPDSFKTTGKQVSAENGNEAPLFDLELAQISPKSENLKNAIIYLIANTSGSKSLKSVERLRKEMTISLAQELMVHGAQVYVIDNAGGENDMGNYVETVNSRYLKNQGKYQRLLVLNLNESIGSSKYFDVSVLHHGKNQEGERFAKNIQHIFNKHRVKNATRKKYTEVFTDEQNLYLAKNVLPPITLIDIGNTKDPSIENRISVRSDQKFISDIITDGVMNDYANIEIEPN